MDCLNIRGSSGLIEGLRAGGILAHLSYTNGRPNNCIKAVEVLVVLLGDFLRQGCQTDDMKLRQIADIRYDLSQSQAEFWGRFGVNQSSGSRIERGQAMPLPISILVRLYLDGVISDADLHRANRRVQIERAL